jgi:hypothetical protein
MLFPDVGYTYIINLDTPFTMKIDNDAFELKSDAFILRYFSEYASYIFPLACLINRTIVEKVKLAPSFVKPSGLPENNSVGFTRF